MPDADSLQPDAPSGQQPDPTPLAVLPDVNAGMPGPGFIDGELHLDPSIAPQVPPGAPRPFAPGEYIRNPDGGWSSEITVTPQLPNGLYVNVPSLWLIDGHPYVAANEDEALQLAIQSKLPFQTYQTEGAAVQASKDREANWKQYDDDPRDARAEKSLWQPRIPVASDALDLSNILPLRPNSKTMLDQAIGNIQGILNPPVSTGPSYAEGDKIPSANTPSIVGAFEQDLAGQGGSQVIDRELQLRDALAQTRMLDQINPPRSEDMMDLPFSNPQYPVTGLPSKGLPHVFPPVVGSMGFMKPDQLMPPQAQPRFGASPINFLQSLLKGVPGLATQPPQRRTFRLPSQDPSQET